MSKPDFWKDRVKAVEISKKAEELDKEVNKWESLKKEIMDLEQLVAEAIRENDLSISDEANKKYQELEKKFKTLEFLVLFSGKYDRNNAIVSIHAGTGGVDAQDWAQILERMFLRFAEKRSWKAELVDRMVGTKPASKAPATALSATGLMAI
jgi:peptide chain release factor 2